jgi:hypothetical protein
MSAERTLDCDLKTEVDFVPRGADFRCDLKTEVDFSCRAQRTYATLEVDFRLSHGADIRCDYNSRLCARWVDLRCKKMKSSPRREKQMKIRENELYCHRSGLTIATVEVDLRLRLQKSTCVAGADTRCALWHRCVTRVGLGAAVSVDLCHRSGLGATVRIDLST